MPDHNRGHEPSNVMAHTLIATQTGPPQEPASSFVATLANRTMNSSLTASTNRWHMPSKPSSTKESSWTLDSRRREPRVEVITGFSQASVVGTRYTGSTTWPFRCPFVRPCIWHNWHPTNFWYHSVQQQTMAVAVSKLLQEHN